MFERASPVAQLVKNPPANEGDLGFIPELGRSLEKGKATQSSIFGLEKSMDCIVHGVAKSQTWLSNFHLQALLEEEDKSNTFVEIKENLGCAQELWKWNASWFFVSPDFAYKCKTSVFFKFFDPFVSLTLLIWTSCAIMPLYSDSS